MLKVGSGVGQQWGGESALRVIVRSGGWLCRLSVQPASQ
jgi:hypothetical protein